MLWFAFAAPHPSAFCHTQPRVKTRWDSAYDFWQVTQKQAILRLLMKTENRPIVTLLRGKPRATVICAGYGAHRQYLERWLDKASVYRVQADQLDSFTASLAWWQQLKASYWRQIIVASPLPPARGYMRSVKLLPKQVEREAKTCCWQRNTFITTLCSCFIAKISSSPDKT